MASENLSVRVYDGSSTIRSCEDSSLVLAAITRQISSTVSSLDFLPKQDYVFIEELQDRYKCGYCRLVLRNPHQTGCGHRFCEKCISSLQELSETPGCPIDQETINSHEIFTDNCCKREVLNLLVYCKNSPCCDGKIPLGRYQEHLTQCAFESVQCTNEGWDCPKYPVPCPNNCSVTSPRAEVNWGIILLFCPEAELQCPFSNYGCHVKVRRAQMKEHEEKFVRDHMLYVLNCNSKLEKQVLQLWQNLELKEQQIQQLSETVKRWERDCIQFLVGTNGHPLYSTQALSSYIDKALGLEEQVAQLVQLVRKEQNHFDLGTILEVAESTKQRLSHMETYRDLLENLDCQFKKHDVELNNHRTLLSCNEERFRLLEGTSFNGKLIWKITDYEKKKQEAIEGRVVSLFSQHFYTSHYGYRMGARVYLNGDGSGKGAYLSLYIVVMKGEFDSLLAWPFKQKVTLMMLDQSGRKNHITDVFRADPHSSSFKRPDNEMNIASGCPRFVSHVQLENPKNACYIKDDTLFIKVTVDLTDLEEL
ncbi:hypothetical protein GDO86_008950 [Hymenochirus boettgeri]|uniref:TNF receptor-associated factor n=1 Tax=Hymenochirus boettgeri TaxID=247094 RepID=A0A8T2JJ92_9PIPI|nr:hypothetical protein GDO86_008950 [Hymenochirus boettgeri]